MSRAVKYSVIIPAYNAEKTIERCLRSLTEQNRQDVEIIVVNDGSTDATASILQKYADEQDSVICIHQENSGVSHARNIGLAHASGLYITFVDSDDYVAETYFEELDKMDGCVDLCYFQTEIIGGKQVLETELFDQINGCTQWGEKMKLLLSSREIMHPFNKRFKRQLIQEKQLSFVENLHISEDFNFCLAYSVCCATIKTYNSQIYRVDITNENSLSRKARPNLTADIVYGFHIAAATLGNSEREDKESKQLLTVLDYLYTKNVCTCISETFKYLAPGYLRNRKVYQIICQSFREPLGSGNEFYGILHRLLRVLLKYNCFFPFYVVSWCAKERQFRKYRLMP